MTITLRPYPAYKDSGVEWLGKVPEHWRVLSSRRLFRETTRKYVPDQNGVVHLSLSQRAGLVPVDQLEKKTLRTESYDKFKVCLPDDLILNRFKAHLGVFFASKTTGIVTFHYGVFQPIVRLVTDYYEILFHTPAYKTIFAGACNGMTVGLQNLSNNNFYQVRSIVPPLAEQAGIVKCVRWIEQNCRRFIRAKRRMIALLNEQKQAIIHRAVTRGLNPDVRLKPSGVEWLGEVPEHWEVLFNRRLFRETTRKYLGGDEIPLSLSQRDGLIPTDALSEKTLRTASYDKFKICVPGDLVLNRFKAHLGVFFESTLTGIVTFHYGVFRPTRASRTKYYELLYHTDPYKTIYAGASNGMTVGLQNLSNENFYRVPSLVPPLSEQDAILAYLATATLDYEASLAKEEAAIKLMREYRTRLITDVVTGKLDARGLDIPDVLEELEGYLEEEESEPSEDPEGTLDKEVDESEDS